MKRTLALFLALLMALSLCACGDDGFQAQYDELTAELKKYSDRCDYAAQIVESGWAAFNESYSIVDEQEILSLVFSHLNMAMSVGRYESLADMMANENVTEEEANGAILTATRFVDPDNWKAGGKYGQFVDPNAADETIVLCNQLYSIMEYGDSEITTQVSDFYDEHSGKHKEACDRLVDLCGTVGLYTLKIASPDCTLPEFQTQIRSYQNTIADCLSTESGAAAR